jgi:hypothetical protein
MGLTWYARRDVLGPVLVPMLLAAFEPAALVDLGRVFWPSLSFYVRDRSCIRGNITSGQAATGSIDFTDCTIGTAVGYADAYLLIKVTRDRSIDVSLHSSEFSLHQITGLTETDIDLAPSLMRADVEM